MAKGKHVVSWADLPHDIIRLVADHVIHSQPVWIPQIWSPSSPNSGHKAIWKLLIQYQTLSGLQNVCRQWESAMNMLDFWHKGLGLLDPRRKHDVFSRNLNSREQLSPGVMFRHVFNSSCMPCRINAYWDTQIGIGTSVQQEQTPLTSFIGCCAMHAHSGFCFVCLRDAFQRERSPSGLFWTRATLPDPGLQRTNDEDAFRYCKTTCNSCRSEELADAISRELGSAALERARSNVITRNLMHQFIWGAIGTVAASVGSISAQFWLSENTEIETEFKLLLERERAKRRAPSGYPLPDAAQTALRAATSPKVIFRLRQKALSHWAITRVIDGIWLSPRDANDVAHFGPLMARIRASHASGQYAIRPYGSEEETVWAEEFLSELFLVEIQSSLFMHQIQHEFETTFKFILLPALKNCFARLIALAEAEGIDPVQLVQKIQVEDLFTCEFLLAPEIWCKDFDWAAHFAFTTKRTPSTSSLSTDRSRPNTASSVGEQSLSSREPVSESISSGDGDGERSPTSPGTTIQTTPSPGPLESPDTKANEASPGRAESSLYPSQMTRRSPPAGDSDCTATPASTTANDSDPALKSPASDKPLQLKSAPKMIPLQFVPFVPTSSDLLGKSVLYLLRGMWDEVVQPVYECSCAVCTRALEALFAATGEVESAIEALGPDEEKDVLMKEMRLIEAGHRGGDRDPRLVARNRGSDIDWSDYEDEEEDEYDEDEEEDYADSQFEDDDAIMGNNIEVHDLEGGENLGLITREVTSIAKGGERITQRVSIDAQGRKSYQTTIETNPSLNAREEILSQHPAGELRAVNRKAGLIATQTQSGFELPFESEDPDDYEDEDEAPMRNSLPMRESHNNTQSLVRSVPLNTVPSNAPLPHPLAHVVPSTPPRPTQPHPYSPVQTSHVYSRAQMPAPPVAGTRRSRSAEDSEDDEVYFVEAAGKSKSKRRRSASVERVVGERRLRDDEDVGGPDGEIVLDEEEIGHGRKRVRSFDAEIDGTNANPTNEITPSAPTSESPLECNDA